MTADPGRYDPSTGSAGKVVVVIQARMGSTRLPGKVLLPIGGKPALAHTIDRVRYTGLPYILTIPDGKADDPLYDWAVSYGVPVHRGSEHDVLLRMTQAVATFGTPDRLVRVTGDCPFVQPEAIATYARYCNWYASNAHPDRRAPKGLDVEVISVKVLEMANQQATGTDREHVTPWMRRYFGFETSTDDGEFRVTLDTADDYERLKWIAARVTLEPPHPTTAELRAMLT